MSLVVTKATESAQVFAAGSVSLRAFAGPVFAILASLQALHHRLIVTMHERRGSGEGTEIIRPVATANCLNLLAARIRLSGAAHVRLRIERGVVRRQRLFEHVWREHGAECTAHRRQLVHVSSAIVLLVGEAVGERVRGARPSHGILARWEHCTEDGTTRTLLVRVELERRTKPGKHGLAPHRAISQTLELARHGRRGGGRRVVGRLLVYNELVAAAHGERVGRGRTALLREQLRRTLSDIGHVRNVDPVVVLGPIARALEVRMVGEVIELRDRGRSRRRRNGRGQQRVVLDVERGDGRRGRERGMCLRSRRRRDEDK